MFISSRSRIARRELPTLDIANNPCQFSPDRKTARTYNLRLDSLDITDELRICPNTLSRKFSVFFNIKIPFFLKNRWLYIYVIQKLSLLFNLLCDYFYFYSKWLFLLGIDTRENTFKALCMYYSCYYHYVYWTSRKLATVIIITWPILLGM